MRTRSIFTRMLSLLLLLTLVAACGGGGGGGAVGGGTATGIFTKVTSTSIGGWAGFFTDTHNYAFWQNLYLSSAIDAAGNVTGVAIQYQIDLTSAVTCTGITIKMGHTMLSAITNTFANNVANGKGGQTTVLSNGIVTFPTGSAGNWQNISLTTPFAYNGVDNLVVEFERTGTCTGTVRDADVNPGYTAIAWSFTPTASGSSGSFVQNMKLSFSGGDNVVDYASNGNNAYMFTTSSKMQMLYTAAEISGSGPITGIGFHVASVTTGQTYTYTVKLAHAVRSALTSTFADNFDNGSPVTVANLATFTVPAGIPVGDYLWLPLTGVFTYNGVDNLLVEVVVTAGSGNTFIQRNYLMPLGRSVYSGTSGAATGTEDTRSYDTKFRFNGGTMNVIGADDSGLSNFFFGTPEGRQFHLKATDLGTAGTISKFACRLTSDSTATTYPNFTLILSHTTQTGLVATDATNIAGGTTVYDGAFTMPGGLVVGDWVEIPFTTAFSYNGTSNLAIQVTSGGGGLTQSCRLSVADAVRYADSWKATGGGSPLDYRLSARFWMSK